MVTNIFLYIIGLRSDIGDPADLITDFEDSWTLLNYAPPQIDQSEENFPRTESPTNQSDNTSVFSSQNDDNKSLGKSHRRACVYIRYVSSTLQKYLAVHHCCMY